MKQKSFAWLILLFALPGFASLTPPESLSGPKSGFAWFDHTVAQVAFNYSALPKRIGSMCKIENEPKIRRMLWKRNSKGEYPLQIFVHFNHCRETPSNARRPDVFHSYEDVMMRGGSGPGNPGRGGKVGLWQYDVDVEWRSDISNGKINIRREVGPSRFIATLESRLCLAVSGKQPVPGFDGNYNRYGPCTFENRSVDIIDGPEFEFTEDQSPEE